MYISVGLRRYLVPTDLASEMWDICEVCDARGACLNKPIQHELLPCAVDVSG